MIMKEDAGQEESPLRELYEEIQRNLDETGIFYDALEETGAFPDYMIQMARIGEQTHRAVAEADDELDDDEEQVERNAQHEGPVERRGVGRERMMMVMMRFLCHIV